MTLDDRHQVLAALRQIAPPNGAAEDDDPRDRLRRFYLAPTLVQALDPSILLVLGERGTGKTELFEVLRMGGLAALLDVMQDKRVGDIDALTIGEQDWGRQSEVSQLFAEGAPHARSAYWLGLLARRVLTVPLLPAPPGDVGDALAPGASLRGWASDASLHQSRLYAWLDAVDADLASSGRYLVVCYDQLDRITLTYQELFSPLRALLQLWFEQRRRWSRIRPKLFLRPDLFDADTLAFPDGSKFFRASHRELLWQRADLYRTWLKRLANGPHGAAALRWAERTAPQTRWKAMGKLGHYPRADESALRPLVHDLVGPYMGGGARKGESYAWVPNHVQDARHRLAPRSFLALWRAAAESASARLPMDGHPMRPEDFTSGLTHASEARIAELREDDPWMGGLGGALEGVRVPAERAELEERLVSARWPRTERPPPYDPVTQAPLLLDHLARRGIVEARADGRMTVPDLYLFGLKMKRKGGAKRAR